MKPVGWKAILERWACPVAEIETTWPSNDTPLFHCQKVMWRLR